MNRQEFISGKGKDQLSEFIKSRIMDLGENGAKKILFFQVSPESPYHTVSPEMLEEITEVATRQLKALGVGNVGVLVAPKNIEVSVIDLGEKN